MLSTKKAGITADKVVYVYISPNDSDHADGKEDLEENFQLSNYNLRKESIAHDYMCGLLLNRGESCTLSQSKDLEHSY